MSTLTFDDLGTKISKHRFLLEGLKKHLLVMAIFKTHNSLLQAILFYSLLEFSKESLTPSVFKQRFSNHVIMKP